MDNEAFRALVQERAREKTTKEIARESVEEEWRNKRKRGRKKGGGGGSSSEDSDNGDDSDGEGRGRKDKEDTSNLSMIPAAAQKRRKLDSKYRDRAKERREGKNTDYAATSSLLDVVTDSGPLEDNEMDKTTLSKYLGGDEEHTHLVKGLDIALARKLKREMGKDSASQDADLEIAFLETPQDKKSPSAPKLVKTADEARQVLRQLQSSSIATQLGRDMLMYLKKAHLSKQPLSTVSVSQSPAGVAIQHSTLTFSTMGHPGDRLHSWEVPRESIEAASRSEGTGSTRATPATPLDRGLLMRIQQALSSKGGKGRSTTSHEHDDMKKHKVVERKEIDSSSDDDIFEDAGKYVPTSTAGVQERQEKSKEGKKGDKSIFAGLTRTQDALLAQAKEEPQNVPSILLSRVKSKPKLDPTQGISIAGYEGGYGEEMDVDFDGRLAEDEDVTKGKKQKEETTVGASEYGQGRAKSKNYTHEM